MIGNVSPWIHVFFVKLLWFLWFFRIFFREFTNFLCDSVDFTWFSKRMRIFPLSLCFHENLLEFFSWIYVIVWISHDFLCEWKRFSWIHELFFVNSWGLVVFPWIWIPWNDFTWNLTNFVWFHGNFKISLFYFFQGKTKQGQFALDTSVKSITYYKEFFGVSYPLPKYDCIAIADFQMGAMENWGLVTFRETAVLVDPTNTSQKTKQWVAIGKLFLC